jgi:hypothetical protein
MAGNLAAAARGVGRAKRSVPADMCAGTMLRIFARPTNQPALRIDIMNYL